MATADITSLIVQVRSDNISNTTKQLQDFVNVSAKAEAANIKLGNSSKPHAESQRASAAATEALIAKMQRQVDLLGANTSQTNTYTAAMKNLGTTEQHLARALGAEVDAYKRLSKDQGAAIKLNGSLDASYKKLTAEANKYYNSQKKAQGAGNALNELGQRQQAFTRLSQAQAEAIRMNKAFDASIRRQQTTLQRRDIETHNASVRAYSKAQAEAIRMNALMDAGLRSGAVTRNTAEIRRHNEAMREAHAAARGLSGSLGALWMTYGAFAGMAVGIAVGASLKGILTVGKDIEHVLETTRVKGNETVESANKMRDAIYSIGDGVYGPQEVVRALEVLVLAGLTAAQSMAALRPALNLATAGGTDIKTAAEGLVTIGTAVGATAQHYTMLADGISTAANISLASVESITNAVKRASVVNKLYGASFEDILIQASALANLGIKGTAAGTAITNFYSDMQGKSDKAKAALAELNMTFSDATGRAKPLVAMVKELNDSLNNFNPEKQKTLVMDIFGERSKRDVVAITSMIRSAANETGKYGSKLEEIADQISKMAGVSTLAAVQIALTTENQIKSMSNTLKVTLAKTFTELEPQVNVFTAKMKEAFNSPQFAATLVTIASSVASLTVGIVRNIGPLSLFIAGLIALKLATSGMAIATLLTGPLMAAATAFGATSVAAGGATVATGLFGTAIKMLPFVGLAAGLATVIGALIMYKFHMDGAKNSAIQTAEAYRSNYLDALKDEEDQLKRTTDNLAKGMPLMEAQTRGIKEQALEKSRLNNANAIGAAQDDLNAAKQGFTDSLGPEYLRMAEKNGKLPPVILALTQELKNQKAASKAFEEQQGISAGNIISYSEKIRLAYIAEQAAAQAAADAAAGASGGKPKEDKHGDSVRLATQLATINAEIASGVKRNDADKLLFQSEYKQSKIGELALIEKIRVAEADSQAAIIDGEIKKMKILGATKDQSAAYVEAKAKVLAGIKATEDAEANAAGKREEYIVKLTEATLKSDAKMKESNGQYVDAYESLFKKKHEAEQKRLADNYTATKDAAVKELILKQQVALQSEFDAGTSAARVKEASASFENLRGQAANLFKGLIADNEGGGIGQIFTAAQEASEKFAQQLPALQAELLRAKALMEADGASPEATKNFNETQAALQNLANNQKTMWASVGESISRSLGEAFGSAGKAAGKLFIISQNYGRAEDKIAEDKAKSLKAIENLQGAGIDRVGKAAKVSADFDKKSSQARISAYGDMAGAAKDFFEENSAGYKIMGAAEQVFRAIELAGMVQSVYTTITTEAQKNTAKIPGVFMRFMEMLGPYGMAAAGLAITAVLGSSMGGGGSGGVEAAQEAQKKRLETQGTGTVFGDSDAKSESVQNSLNLLAEYAFENLEYSNKMLTAMQSIASALTGVSKSLALTQGLMSGTAFNTLEGSSAGGLGSIPLVGKLLGSIFGGGTSSAIVGSGINVSGTVGGLSDKNGTFNQYETVSKTKKGGWFSSDKSWTEENLRGLDDSVISSFSKTFDSVRDGLVEVGTTLGLGATQLASQINAIPINLSVELRGLKGKELEEAVTSVFSAQIDIITEQALAIVIPYQKMGEGLFETAVRVANSSRVIDLELQSIGMAFGAVGTRSLAARMALVDLMGGLEEFTAKTDFFKDNFLTEAQRMAPVTAAVTREMQRLNISSVDTIDEFSKLVLAQDLSTVAGQKMYVSLMAVAPAFYKATEYAADLAEGIVSLTNAQQRAMDLIDKKRSQLQESYDSESSALQDTIDKMGSFVEGLKAFKESLLTGAASPLTNAEKYAQAFAKFNETSLLAKGGDDAAQKEFQTVANNLLAASKIYNASGNQYLVDFNRVISETSALSAVAGGQVSVAQASLDALNLQVSGLLDINKSVMSVTQAVYELQAAILLGKAEGLTEAQMDGSHANGLASVPFDGYRATLHKGEQVLTANQAVNYKQMGTLDMAPLVAEIKSLRSELTALRSEQADQTGKLIMSNYDANQRAAGDVVEGVDKSINSAAKRETPALN